MSPSPRLRCDFRRTPARGQLFLASEAHQRGIRGLYGGTGKLEGLGYGSRLRAEGRKDIRNVGFGINIPCPYAQIENAGCKASECN